MLKDYVVIDLETTGFSTATCDIIEIGAIKVENNIVVSVFNELVNPNRYIPRNIQKLTGITNEDVKNCDTIDIALKRLSDYIGNLPLVGFNLPFDYGFLLANGVSNGIDFTLKGTQKGIDVLKLARKYFDLPSYKLQDIANSLHIKPNLDGSTFHRAYYDAYVTYIIYVTMINTFGLKTDIITPRNLVDDNRMYGKVVNCDALSLDA